MNAERLQLACQEVAGLVPVVRVLQFCVVVEEEGEIVVRDVDIWVSAKFAVLLNVDPAAAESILVDFFLCRPALAWS